MEALEHPAVLLSFTCTPSPPFQISPNYTLSLCIANLPPCGQELSSGAAQHLPTSPLISERK